MLTKEQLGEIIDKYNRGEDTGYTDEEYDALLEEYLKANGGESNRPYNRQTQTGDVNDIVGTLPKAYGVSKAMREGQKVYTDFVSKFPYDEVYVQPKFDGCSIALDLTTGRWFTRGDYDDGESVDVTDVFQHIDINKMREHLGLQPRSTSVKFEAILSHETYNDQRLGIYLKYKRPRDFVAATITSRNTEYAKLITLVPLREYHDGKQYIPVILQKNLSQWCKPNDLDVIEDFIQRLSKDDFTVMYDQAREWMTYSVDGVVVSPVCNDGGYACTDPATEVAIKIIHDVKKTKLITVEYQFGKQGRITPVAILEPVQFGNVTVDHVTLSTIERVVNMKLRHNDTVRIMYNIVPYLIDSEHDGGYPIDLVRNCPICNAPLVYMNNGKIVKCTNPDCSGLKLGAIIRHAEKMKMMGISAGIIRQLYDAGIVNSIPDLYNLKSHRDEIIGMSGFGEKSYTNMINSIDSAVRSTTLARCLGAMPFNDTSEETWKRVISVMGNNEVITTMLDGSFPNAILVHGYIPSVGELKIKKIIDGYIRNKQELCVLINWIKGLLTQDDNTTKVKVALSGTRDKDLIDSLESQGFEVKDNLTKDCEILVIPESTFTSSKVEKAKKMGIKIMTMSQIALLMAGANARIG